MEVWYYHLRAALVNGAVLIMGIATWFVLPGAIAFLFNMNAVWLTGLWGFIYSHFPGELRLPLEVIQSGYGFMLGLLHQALRVLPPMQAVQTEVFVRAVLGEGWVLLMEIAIPIRILWWQWRRRENEVVSPLFDF